MLIYLLWETGQKLKASALIISARAMNYSLIFLILLFVYCCPSYGALENKISDNEKQYGKELVSKQFSEGVKSFSGKKVYQFPLYGWQVEAIYKDGKVISESTRPKGKKVIKEMLSEREGNVIADIMYPKKDRGPYRKQINNAHFISHFFESGVVSFEMKLDQRGKNHLGVIGVRTVLYSNGDRFKNIKVNAYQ